MSLTRLCTATAASLTILFAATTSVEGATASETPSKISALSSLRLKTGESFVATRARIIRHGWTPIRMHSNDTYEYDGAEKRLAERGFLEVDSCSTDAGAHCILYYLKADKCLRLDTVGEQVIDMKITRWTEECPQKNEGESTK
jgi:hypothetical protein